MHVVAEAADGVEAIEQALANDVDLAILDVSMPRLTGLQAAAELHARRPGMRVLILSVHDNEQYFFEALKAGASGYVLKTAANRDLVAACRASMRGEPFLYPAAVTALIRDYLERARSGESGPRGPTHPARASGGQADRRGIYQRRHRSPALDQQEDCGSSSRQHPREARPPQCSRADAVCDPSRPRRTLVRLTAGAPETKSGLTPMVVGRRE